MHEDNVLQKRKSDFKKKHGFWPHQEKCGECGRRRADHSVWVTDLYVHKFVKTGEEAK